MPETTFGPFNDGVITAINPLHLEAGQAQDAGNTETRHGILEGILNLGVDVTVNLEGDVIVASPRSFWWHSSAFWRTTASPYDRFLNHLMSTTFFTRFTDATAGRPGMGKVGPTVANPEINEQKDWLMGINAPLIATPSLLTGWRVAAQVSDSYYTGKINSDGKKYNFSVTYDRYNDDGSIVESNPTPRMLATAPVNALKTYIKIEATIPSDLPDAITHIRFWRTETKTDAGLLGEDGPLCFLAEVPIEKWEGHYIHGNNTSGDTSDAQTDVTDRKTYIHWGEGGRASANWQAPGDAGANPNFSTNRSPYLDEDHSPPPSLTCLSNIMHSATGSETSNSGIWFGAIGNIACWCSAGKFEYCPVFNYHPLPDYIEAILTRGDQTLYFTQREITSFNGQDDENLSVIKTTAAFGVRAQCGKTVCDTPYGVFFLAEEGLAVTDGVSAEILTGGIVDRDYWDTLAANDTHQIQAVYAKGRYILFHSQGCEIFDLHQWPKIVYQPSNIVVLAAHVTGLKKLTGAVEDRNTYYVDPFLYVLLMDGGEPRIRQWGDSIITTDPVINPPKSQEKSFSYVSLVANPVFRGVFVNKIDSVYSAIGNSGDLSMVLSLYNNGSESRITMNSAYNALHTFGEIGEDLLIASSFGGAYALRRLVGGALAAKKDFAYNAILWHGGGQPADEPAIFSVDESAGTIFFSSGRNGIFAGSLDEEGSKVSILAVNELYSHPSTGETPPKVAACRDAATGDIHAIVYGAANADWYPPAEIKNRIVKIRGDNFLTLYDLDFSAVDATPKKIQVDKFGNIWVLGTGTGDGDCLYKIAVDDGVISVLSTTHLALDAIDIIADDENGLIWFASSLNWAIGYVDCQTGVKTLTSPNGLDFSPVSCFSRNENMVVAATSDTGYFPSQLRIVSMVSFVSNGWWTWTTGDDSGQENTRLKRFRRVRLSKRGKIAVEVYVDGAMRHIIDAFEGTPLRDDQAHIFRLPPGLLGRTISLKFSGGIGKVYSAVVEYEMLGG